MHLHAPLIIPRSSPPSKRSAAYPFLFVGEFSKGRPRTSELPNFDLEVLSSFLFAITSPPTHNRTTFLQYFLRLPVRDFHRLRILCPPGKTVRDKPPANPIPIQSTLASSKRPEPIRPLRTSSRRQFLGRRRHQYSRWRTTATGSI